MAGVHPNIKRLKYRTRLGSLQENPQIIRKEPLCRKRIFSDTDTTKTIKNESICDEQKLKNRRPLQDIQNKNLGAIPKIINKFTKETKHKSKFEKQILRNVSSKIQTPKKPKPKKIHKLKVEAESFKIPKFVTTARGENNHSFLPDLISDSFVTNIFPSQEFEEVQILHDSGSTNKENEIKISDCKNKKNLKRSRSIVDDDNVFNNEENVVNEQIVKRTRGKTSNEISYHPSNIFSKTYLEETITYYLYLEKPGKIFQERPVIFNRTLNWLIQINDDLNAPPDVLFTAVLLFNEVLNKMEISWCSMQLAGLACYRIVHKHFDASNVQWSIVLSYLDATISDLNKMEQNILAKTKFKTDIAEPSIFVYYYSSLLQEYMNCIDKKLEKCVFYIIESLMFSPAFFTQLPSKIAAAAMDLSFQMLKPDLICWQLLVARPGYYGYTELKGLKMEMLNMLLKLEDISFPYRSSFNKYYRPSNSEISMEIRNNNYVKNLISYF
ncbi:G2/mitotic-specific cyclin-B-like [Chrysoperla carnea]|uniref:G2/mitotic-specific cyclin-B-like n=1 Tax=Chrysoperla carnea TaxID=189513 RepID=UPI001D08D20C|nr:G2/mitotic-specific cyclin-B-like [Chrysoperla carnea]